jgi:hypothetical protein
VPLGLVVGVGRGGRRAAGVQPTTSAMQTSARANGEDIAGASTATTERWRHSAASRDRLPA